WESRAFVGGLSIGAFILTSPEPENGAGAGLSLPSYDPPSGDATPRCIWADRKASAEMRAGRRSLLRPRRGLGGLPQLDREHAIEAQQPEDGARLIAEPDDLHLPAVGADPLEQRDDDADARAVDEAQGGELERDRGPLLVDELVDHGAQLRRRHRVERALDLQGR